MTPTKLVKLMNRLGCEEVRQRGSHVVMRHADGCQKVVPMHKGDIPTGTLRSIERHMEKCLGEGWLR